MDRLNHYGIIKNAINWIATFNVIHDPIPFTKEKHPFTTIFENIHALKTMPKVMIVGVSLTVGGCFLFQRHTALLGGEEPFQCQCHQIKRLQLYKKADIALIILGFSVSIIAMVKRV